MAILLFLSLPNLKVGEVEIGPIHIFIYEIPVILSLILAPFSFVYRKKTFNSQELKAIRSYLYAFIPLILIGVYGSFFSKLGLTTIMSSIRPVLYWVTGVIVIVIGHDNFKLKTLFWVVTIGILLQFIGGIIYSHLGLDISFMMSGRLPGHSAYLVLILITALFFQTTKEGRISSQSKGKEHFLLTCATIIGLVFALLTQNRTSWVVIALAIGFFTFKGKNARFIARGFAALILALLFLMTLTELGIVPEEITNHIQRRFFEETASQEGINRAMLGRDYIYASAYQEIWKRPILGHGFGHELAFIRLFSSIEGNSTWHAQTTIDSSPINVVLKFGLVGLVISFLFLFRLYDLIRRNLRFVNSEDILYVYSFYSAFPFLCLISLNIDVLYSYPEVIVFSLFFCKSICVGGATDSRRDPRSLDHISVASSRIYRPGQWTF